MLKNGKEHLAASWLSRRDLLRHAGGLGLWSLVDHSKLLSLVATAQDKQPEPSPSATAPVSPSLSPEDDQFLEELERLNFQFFWEQGSPQTGLVKDRCNVQ